MDAQFPQLPPEQQPKYTPAEKRGCFLLVLIAVLLLAVGMKILHTPWMAALAFGAVFLFCGSLFIRQARQSPKPQYRWAVLCLSVGAFIAADGVLLLLARIGIVKLPEGEAFGDSVKAVVFLAVGFGILAFMLAGLLHKKKYCTERVEGVCVDLKEIRSHRNRTSVPVYEFFYAGRTHQLTEQTGTAFANPQIGDVRVFYIDPEHLDEMYDPKRHLKTMILPGVMALFCIGIGVFLLVHP